MRGAVTWKSIVVAAQGEYVPEVVLAVLARFLGDDAERRRQAFIGHVGQGRAQPASSLSATSAGTMMMVTSDARKIDRPRSSARKVDSVSASVASSVPWPAALSRPTEAEIDCTGGHVVPRHDLHVRAGAASLS
jgi:hypothetical protein